MVTVTAPRDHMGRQRLFNDLDLSIGLSGFSGDPLIVFEDVKMHEAFSIDIIKMPTYNQQLRYLKDVMYNLVDELDTLQYYSKVKIITDKNNYNEYIKDYEKYVELDKLCSNISSKIRRIKYSLEEEKISPDEGEKRIKELEKEIIKPKDEKANYGRLITDGYWDKYLGAEFTINGNPVRVVVMNKRHRYAVKVNKEYKFYLNINAALRAYQRKG